MITIYISFIRSLLEQSAVLWHTSLTDEQSENIERVQKAALRIILQKEYLDYPTALEKTGLQTLYDRRTKLSLNFAKRCAKHEYMNNLFPLNQKHMYNTRKQEKYKVNYANTSRYSNSAIPYMQRLLNKII